jgi:hypothetical protein
MGYQTGHRDTDYITERIRGSKPPRRYPERRPERLLSDGEIDLGLTFNAMRNNRKLARARQIERHSAWANDLHRA